VDDAVAAPTSVNTSVGATSEEVLALGRITGHARLWPNQGQPPATPILGQGAIAAIAHWNRKCHFRR
jgi:hypothetical protein